MRRTSCTDLRGHCPRCLFRTEVCLCGLTPEVQTRTKIIIVRHVGERRRTSNTGRLAALALPNSEIIDYGLEGSFDGSALDGPGAWLLYPDAGRSLEARPPPARLVVLDATWRQARRMFRRIDALRAMPKLALEGFDAVRLRRPTHPCGMSTLEAIAHALGLLEGPERCEPLLRYHLEAVRRALSLQGRTLETERPNG